MRCFVTGASGHLGSYLTRLLLIKGDEVAIFVRPQSDLWRLSDVLPELKQIRGDLSQTTNSYLQIKSFMPEIVFHLAWHGVTADYHNESDQITKNLNGSLQLLQIVQELGCNCFIGLGSQAEYGPCNAILREDLPAQPVTAYGVAKLCIGMLTAKQCQIAGIRHVWFRLLATYGPKDSTRHLIPNVILKLLAGERPALTLGEQRWDYLYVTDAAEAIYQAAINSRAKGIFNLGSGQAYTVQSIVECIRDLIDPNLPLGFGEVPYNFDQPMHLQADNRRFSSCTGWSPSTPLEVGLVQTVDWYRDNKDRYAD